MYLHGAYLASGYPSTIVGLRAQPFRKDAYLDHKDVQALHFLPSCNG